MFEQQLLMLKEIIHNPRDMGTFASSSRALAGEMASALSPRTMKNGTLVEVGAGTGPVTAALLERGVPSDRLVVIEKSPALAECLMRRFPNVNVRCCGAEEMSSCLGAAPPVTAIISSLPFRSLPKSVSIGIMEEVERTLAPGGIFVQFTYALIGEIPCIPAAFRKVRSRLVFLNFPPAKVEVFVKPKPRRAYVD
ncbi:MAG: methyltransferase domain-containing protein [Synergistaceae bacterium]|jgi:phospholipid N-methyltransferase|nr:methyltransferase domain-containing protein [Synergistaceae bacterium]